MTTYSIPFIHDARFRIYFEPYRSVVLNSECYEFLLTQNDLTEKFKEDLSRLGYDVDSTLDMDDEDDPCFSANVEPNDPADYFRNTIRLIKGSKHIAMIRGYSPSMGPIFWVHFFDVATDTQKKDILEVVKDAAGISKKQVENRLTAHTVRRRVVPELVVQRQLPTEIGAKIRGFLGRENHRNNAGYAIHNLATKKQRKIKKRRNTRRR